ncbi:MAG: DUF6268 family outer membrane beta-barrel protein [Planctomycetota bacterium]
MALTCLLICFAVASDVSAQTPVYGGQVVQELMPPPSDTIFLPPGQSNLPFEPAPMFTSPGTHTSDVYASHPIVVQPPTPAATSGLPPGVRKGLFQKVFFTGTYIPQFDDDSFGFGDLEAGVVLGVPLLRPSTPLLITPRFAVHYLDRPGTLDLPEEVYDAEVSFRHLRKFGEGPWAMNAAITLGHYSDFEASDADAFRVTGQAFAVYESSPAWTWVFGVVYLNRRDLSVIPAVGAIYKPHADLKFDAILPRPRISWRLPDGLLASNTERWAYVGGEFGGGIWSIDRSATVGQDLMTYNDFRLLMGIETKADLGAISHRLEFGYVFGRELEFSSATPNVELDDSLFVRVGLKY